MLGSLSLGSFLTASVVVAVGAFIVREVIAEYREHRTRKRKIKAIKSAILKEISRNILAHNAVKGALGCAQDKFQEEPQGIFQIVTRPSGRTEYKSYYHNGAFSRGGGLPDISMDLSTKVYLDVFELDKSLAIAFETYQEALSDLRHVRLGLFDYSEPGTFDIEFFEGFIDWAFEELEHVKAGLLEAFNAFGGKGETVPKLA